MTVLEFASVTEGVLMMLMISVFVETFFTVRYTLYSAVSPY